MASKKNKSKKPVSFSIMQSSNKVSGGSVKTPLKAQYVLSFIMLVLTAGVSIGAEVLAALRIDTNYLLITLIAIVISLLVVHRHILLVVLVVGMSLSVNLPEAVLVDYGINRNILFGTLVAIIFEPLIMRFF